MSKEVDIKDLATEIAAGLIEYDQNVADEIKTIVDDVAQEGVDELKQSSPKLTGSYRRGWRKNRPMQIPAPKEILCSTKRIIKLHICWNMDTQAEMAGV